MDEELKAALEKLFAADSSLYQSRGFQRRVGYGSRPALLNIDLANAWTRPGYPFTCENMDTIIPSVQALLSASREKRIPVIYTTTAYDITSGPNTDMGLWHKKIPAETLNVGSESVAIDNRIAPADDEFVITKKRASAFHGTPLAGYLRAAQVDTLLVTGVTMSACVRNSVEDAIAEGFRPIVVREAVGDRIAGAVEWNLFDVDAKFGDVERLEAVLNYLSRLPASRNDPVPMENSQS
ncbi:MAG: isochorismatase family protein [Pseudomonadota bacterium]